MLSRIKNYFIGAGIIAAVLIRVYFMGKQKGINDEKIKNAMAVQNNIARAMRARGMLYDADFVRRLRDKYSRR